MYGGQGSEEELAALKVEGAWVLVSDDGESAGRAAAALRRSGAVGLVAFAGPGFEGDSYAARFERGDAPENFDKEFVRLAYARANYRGDGDPPIQPESLWIQTSERYVALYEMLTGTTFEPGAYPVEPRLVENLQRAGILPP